MNFYYYSKTNFFPTKKTLHTRTYTLYVQVARYSSLQYITNFLKVTSTSMKLCHFTTKKKPCGRYLRRRAWLQYLYCITYMHQH